MAPFEIVVVGTSSGGLKALTILLSSLDAQFSLPIVIVQHRGKDSELALSEYLGQRSVLPLREPDDKEKILPGHVYLAPRDYHLLVDHGSFALSIDGPVVFARPSIDVLFQSVADEYQERAIGVILTGGSRDGSLGLARIKARGGVTIVQDPETAMNKQMPQGAIESSNVDWVIPLEEIGPRLIRLAAAAGQYV